MQRTTISQKDLASPPSRGPAGLPVVGLRNGDRVRQPPDEHQKSSFGKKKETQTITWSEFRSTSLLRFSSFSLEDDRGEQSTASK